MIDSPDPPASDGRRARGDRSRAEVLVRGLELATVHGLTGFSLADLASASGTSKAGISGLFGPKEQLQQAITAHARDVLATKVLLPTMAADRGIAQIETLGRVWIDYLADPTLVGGCFFAPAFFELDSQPGHLQDAIRDDMRGWITAISAIISDGQDRDQILDSASAQDEAFAFFSLGITTNTAIQISESSDAADRARRLWHNNVARLRA